MILKGSQRAGATPLAAHLLRVDENDHVEVHELRGFVANDLHGALKEAYAVSKGTRCRQFLFSLSLNPPQTANVSEKDFKAAIRAVEQQLGLTNQPRAIVFHEKEGRRHAHCVWSRIDTQTMTAINLPHFKRKLMSISRELYIQHDWRMPEGMVDSRQRDPTNFSRAEWQQSKRTGIDPRAVKTLFQQCWAASDSRAALARALEERGFWLAKGDRRSFVAVDFRGEVYNIARYAGQRTKAVNERLGDPNNLPTVEQTKARIAARMTATLQDHIRDAEREFAQRGGALHLQKRDMVRRQRQDRLHLDQRQQDRWRQETNLRAARLPKGLRGLWEWLMGRYGKIKRQNEREAIEAYRRDQTEKRELIRVQLAERRELQQLIRAARNTHTEELKGLYHDVADYIRMGGEQRPTVKEQFRTATEDKRPPIRIEAERTEEKTLGGGRTRRMGGWG